MKKHRSYFEYGYTVRWIAERGWVFVEGHKEPVYFLARGEMKKFNACLKRRGIGQLRYGIHSI